MKHVFVILILFLSNSSLFSQNGKSYSIPQYKKGELYSYTGSSQYTYYYDFVWHGDTSVNGELYTKVFLNNVLHAIVREDTIVDSLYVINTLGEKFGAPVIHDLKVGDSVKVFSWHYKLFWDFDQWDYPDFELDTVTKIEQVLVNGKHRNKYYFDRVSGPDFGAYLEFIEGVGISNFVFLSGGISIRCFYEKRELGIDIHNGNPPGCSLKHNYVGSDDVVFQSLEFYPNPTSGIINYNLTQTIQVNVYSVSGKEVGSYNLSGVGVLDFSTLPKGIYFLIDQQNLKKQKLIIK